MLSCFKKFKCMIISMIRFPDIMTVLVMIVAAIVIALGLNHIPDNFCFVIFIS